MFCLMSHVIQVKSRWVIRRKNGCDFVAFVCPGLYTREFKLPVIKWHEEHGNIVSGTADKFSIDRKRVR